MMLAIIILALVGNVVIIQLFVTRWCTRCDTFNVYPNNRYYFGGTPNKNAVKRCLRCGKEYPSNTEYEPLKD